jgi:hypothetical protein
MLIPTLKQYKLSRHKISPPLANAAVEWIIAKRRFIPSGRCPQADGRGEKNLIFFSLF